MDGEWPLALRNSGPATPDEQMAEQYQADRASDKDLPGGKKQHEKRTKAAFRRVGAIWAVARKQKQSDPE